jgi:hypothetical protein
MIDGDLLELQKYLETKFGVKVYVNRSKNVNIIKHVNEVYTRLLLVIILAVTVCVLYRFVTHNIFVNTVFIGIALYTVYQIQKYAFMIYFYNKNNLKYEESSVKYSNFNSGDILQEASNWNYNYGILLYLFPLKFLHNLFIIKFKNRDYVLHYTLFNCGYPKHILSFEGTGHIEMFPLQEYLRDNIHATKYYRVFKVDRPIDNDKLFTFIRHLNMRDLKFSFLPCIDKCEPTNTYNCMSFILRLLNYVNILPGFNYYNFSSDDLIHLPGLSNSMYKKPFMMKI